MPYSSSSSSNVEACNRIKQAGYEPLIFGIT